MPSVFRLVTHAQASPEVLFDASLSIDAHVDSMAGARERAIAGVTSGLIGLGETVTWRARHFGVWFTMTSRVSELERPHRFVDEQVRGPFRVFRHVHEFEEDAAGTRMTDEITVGSPVLGALVERLVLVPYLRRLIRRRNDHLAESLIG
ncbi:SRPBCC family protein [Microbacterium sp. CFH 90308]|uniref:SRPBCC family protein n=1 Tax=Microbacterium salsuginis TaxID=2722803 RepID=A0ABX1KCI6_9MICO|nr:SRPBCC family protein [Microbacterium sp. CFH 90308]NLP84749.1 SRPBCC family protein [Microbacterium sp. CFH 90308]